MFEAILPIILGAIISVMGIINMRGNISTIHWYHRKRVAEADKKKFGFLVGLGTLIIGVGVSVMGVLLMICKLTEVYVFEVVGTVITVVSVVMGLVLSFYAMIKYNKGIF